MSPSVLSGVGQVFGYDGTPVVANHFFGPCMSNFQLEPETIIESTTV